MRTHTIRHTQIQPPQRNTRRPRMGIRLIRIRLPRPDGLDGMVVGVKRPE
jgi:hypothetical protein